MKKAGFIIGFLIFFFSHSQAQSVTGNPRFLKHSLFFYPVDYNKAGSREGLFRGNKSTINIDSTIIYRDVAALIKISNSDILKPDSIKIRDIMRDTLLTGGVLIGPDLAFNIVQQSGSFSIIKFWPLKEKNIPGLSARINIAKYKGMPVVPENATISRLKLTIPRDSTTAAGTYDLSKTYYIVPTPVLQDNSAAFENVKGTWNLGFLVLPVKLRPFATERGQFDFSDGYSVGTTFAFTVAQNMNNGLTQSLLLYAGISSYTADSLKLKERRNDYKIAAFSPAAGYMLEKNNVQLSIIIGFDFPAGNLQKKWVYRNQPWFGIGLGFSLFKINVNNQPVTSGTN